MLMFHAEVEEGRDLHNGRGLRYMSGAPQRINMFQSRPADKMNMKFHRLLSMNTNHQLNSAVGSY